MANPKNLFWCAWFAASTALFGQKAELQSYPDEALNYPILVVEAEPYLRPGTNMGSEGNFKVVYRELGTLPAERLRLPVPDSTWKLTGNVGRTRDGTIYAGFGAYLYQSADEGRTWLGRVLEGLPHTEGKRVSVTAFGVGDNYVVVVHAARSLPPVWEDPSDEDNKMYPSVVSRSKDGGETWEASAPLTHPGYRTLAGDGNYIVQLADGTLLAALDGYNPQMSKGESGRFGQVFLRSTDEGETWGDASVIPDTAAETGLLGMGEGRVLAAMRGIPNSRLGGKTIELADSDDRGHTWKNFRPLTHIFGQAHCGLAAIPGGGVVAVYENRYPYADGGRMLSRISWDGGRTWEPELYILSVGHGYAGSVVSEDGTIITVMGDGQLTSRGQPTGRHYTLQAVRWRPWNKSGAIFYGRTGLKNLE
jgi:hypothetical protein